MVKSKKIDVALPEGPGVTDEEWAAMGDVSKEMTTCYNCPENKTCEYAWDPYNTNGDCLVK